MAFVARDEPPSVPSSPASVEEVGTGVGEFRVGDDVFGIRAGSLAEYMAVPEGGVIAAKPSGLTYEEASAIPDGALLALSC